jgi:delta24-sterol reductase
MLQNARAPVSEAIPLVDYLFRYNQGGFWVGAYAFHYFIAPFNRITRRALDYFMHTRVMYRALHQSGQFNMYIIQDVSVPYSAAEEFAEYLDEDFTHYPLWLCPFKQTITKSSYNLMSEKQSAHAPEMLLNFGVWGPGARDTGQFVEMNRRLERKADALGGKKCLYAQAYYTEDEFWKIFRRGEYDALRVKYHASHLPSVYDKVKVDIVAQQNRINASWDTWLLAFFWSIWPLSGVYGVLMAVITSDYLLPLTLRTRQRKSKEE